MVADEDLFEVVFHERPLGFQLYKGKSLVGQVTPGTEAEARGLKIEEHQVYAVRRRVRETDDADAMLQKESLPFAVKFARVSAWCYHRFKCLR